MNPNKKIIVAFKDEIVWLLRTKKDEIDLKLTLHRGNKTITSQKNDENNQIFNYKNFILLKISLYC